MLIILQQIFVLYIFLFLGWFFGKKKPDLMSHTSVLSYLLVTLFLPSKVFNTFAKNFTVSYILESYNIIFISVGLLTLLHFLSKLLAKVLGPEGYLRRVNEYTLTISNYAYMGYALVEGVFGTTALTNIILFCIPFSMYTYTVGYMKLTGKGVTIRRVLNPMTCSIGLGIVFGLLNIPVPEVFSKALSNSAACVGPISMLLTGLTLSSFTVKELLGDKVTYIVVALRLVGIPALVFALFNLCGFHTTLPSALMMAAMPTGLNTIVFPLSVGESPAAGARMAFLSHLLSCVTLPFWLSLLQ